MHHLQNIGFGLIGFGLTFLPFLPLAHDKHPGLFSAAVVAVIAGALWLCGIEIYLFAVGG